ncbi:MAG TPA: class III poly(R)-hydroxyalkanoic acid synthase subunit PhaC [Nitrososphaerales archaeon]|nr:class III poly(R)-hydroxyalkanoic acid synthase subunit PhaC [Nitrososphaerales archaeon]
MATATESEEKKLHDVHKEMDRTPSEVVYTSGRIKLLHYEQIRKEKIVHTPVLIVFALINRYYILDLQQDRSVVRRYLESGIDVYMIDWGNPAPIDKFQTIGDHIEMIDEAVDVILKRSHVDGITLQGYCMGGTFAAIYAALHPSKVKNLIVQAASIDFSTQSGILNVWSRFIDADKIVDTFGNVPSQFLNSSFLLLNPVGLLVDKYVKYYDNIDDKQYVENFDRMEKWIFDSPDVPGEVYRQFIKDLYQKNLLVKGEFAIDGKKVNLKRIDMPLLNIVGEEDNIVPPDSSTPLNDLTSSKDKETISFPSGHIGISVSGKAQKELWPRVAEWIREHSV